MVIGKLIATFGVLFIVSLLLTRFWVKTPNITKTDSDIAAGLVVCTIGFFVLFVLSVLVGIWI